MKENDLEDLLTNLVGNSNLSRFALFEKIKRSKGRIDDELVSILDEHEQRVIQESNK